MNMLAPSPCLAAALQYASEGFEVFPAVRGEKKSHKSAEFSNGAKWGKSGDPEQIRLDFQRWPQANIGIATGEASGIFVVDVDTLDGHGTDGLAEWAKLTADRGLPVTRVSISPSGSRHFYFRWPGRTVPNSSSRIAPGIDVRGEGGIVIAPPSVKPDGRAYHWENDGPIAEAPQWLIDLALKPSILPSSSKFNPTTYRNAALRDEIAQLLAAPPGTRNDTLNRCAFALGQLIAADRLDLSTAESALMAAWLAMGKPEAEGRATINSGLRNGRGSPRFDPAELFRNHPVPKILPPGATPIPEKADELVASALHGVPKPSRDFLVDGLMPDRNVVMISGDGGTGKSLLAMQLAVAVATGAPWLGLSVKRGPVLYMSAEDDRDETHIRLHDICGGDLSGLTQLHLMIRAGRDCLLAVENRRSAQMERTPLFAELSAKIAEKQPKLVVLDNLADIFGGNENDKMLARQFVGMIRSLAVDHDCTVVILSHPSLSGMTSGTGSSGNTAWNNSVRARFYLKRQHDDASEITDSDFRKLVTMKSNYTTTGGEIGMRWEHGRFVATRRDMAVAIDVQHRFLEILREFHAMKRTVSPSPGANYAPNLFSRHPKSNGVTKRQFEMAMNQLFECRKIVVVDTGRPSRPLKSIVAAFDCSQRETSWNARETQ